MSKHRLVSECSQKQYSLTANKISIQWYITYNSKRDKLRITCNIATSQKLYVSEKKHIRLHNCIYMKFLENDKTLKFSKCLGLRVRANCRHIPGNFVRGHKCAKTVLWWL